MLQVSTPSCRHDDVLQPHATAPLEPRATDARTLDTRAVELDSRRLLQGQREIVIRHGGECYRLRHTRNDKLILTK